MSGINGGGRSRWALDLVIGVLIVLLGYLGSRLDQRVDDVEATASAVKVETATLRSASDAKWDEVLRRLNRIEGLLDKDQPRRGGR